MTEIVLALIVFLIGVLSIISVIPAGMNIKKDGYNKSNATDSADQFLNYWTSQIAKDWSVLDNFPLTKPTIEDSVVKWGNSVIKDVKINIAFPIIDTPNERFDYRHNLGVFKMEHVTGTNVDFSCIVRSWKIETKYDYGEDIQLFCEVSFPIELPYSKREKYTYRVLIFKPFRDINDIEPPKGETEDVDTIFGGININPNNNSNNEFKLLTEDGAIINTDTLRSGYFTEYNGKAKFIYVKPKGNGNQNTLMVNGEAYNLENKYGYTIVSDEIMVNLFYDSGMGNWWITIATDDATIVVN